MASDKLLLSDRLDSRKDIAVRAKGMLHRLNHGLKYLFTIKTLKGVVTFHFYQFIETRPGTSRENVLVHGIVRHFTLQNSDYTPLAYQFTYPESGQSPDCDCRSDEISIAAAARIALIFFRTTPSSLALPLPG